VFGLKIHVLDHADAHTIMQLLSHSMAGHVSQAHTTQQDLLYQTSRAMHTEVAIVQNLVHSRWYAICILVGPLSHSAQEIEPLEVVPGNVPEHSVSVKWLAFALDMRPEVNLAVGEIKYASLQQRATCPMCYHLLWISDGGLPHNRNNTTTLKQMPNDQITARH